MNPNVAGSEAIGPSGTTAAGWSRGQWARLVVLIFTVQLGFIFSLGDREQHKPRVTTPVKVRLEANPLPTVNDPTLFALPNEHGVAGLTWLKTPEVERTALRSNPPPRLLPLPVQNLGLAISAAPEANAFASRSFSGKPEPDSLILPTGPAAAAPPATNSTFRVTGDLAQRRWLNPPQLRSWAGTNLLAPTVVQALVDEAGSVHSLTLLPPGSGSGETDDYALQLVRQAHFAPGRKKDGPALGQLIFNWHTEPPPPTAP